MRISLKPLKDQVIIITGASSGIGLATAKLAAKQGARVVAAARNEEVLSQLTEEINDHGGSAIYVCADVGKIEDVARIADTAIRAYGTFDTWVNNAGVSISGGCLEVSIEDMKKMFDTNFWGVVFGSRVAANHFKQRGYPGAIINIGGGLINDKAAVVQSVYAASKHIVHEWTTALRMELEKEKVPISVSLIHPGRVDTLYDEQVKSFQEDQSTHHEYHYAPQAVAEAILHCAEHAKRDMYVGLQTKFFAALSDLSPRLMNKIMEAVMYPAQRLNRPSQTVEESVLYRPGYVMTERGSTKARVRKKSHYVKTSKRPLVSTLVLAGIGAGIWMLNKRKNRMPRS